MKVSKEKVLVLDPRIQERIERCGRGLGEAIACGMAEAAILSILNRKVRENITVYRKEGRYA